MDNIKQGDKRSSKRVTEYKIAAIKRAQKTQDPAIPRVGIYSREMNPYIPAMTRTGRFMVLVLGVSGFFVLFFSTALAFTSPETGNNPKRPSTSERINGLPYIHSRTLLGIKRKELLISRASWMNCECVRLSERSQSLTVLFLAFWKR